MPTIRLSGTILGDEDPARAERAELLYLLFRAGWDIYNSNGDQQITLDNIEKKIIESDAFLFTPNPGIEDLFKAVSIFVGYQTLDKNLWGKPTVLLNGDNSWKGLIDVLTHLHAVGTVGQDHEDFLLQAGSPSGALKQLNFGLSRTPPDPGRESLNQPMTAKSFESPMPDELVANVCVFCSATLEDPAYLEDGRRLGQLLAENHFGCVSGAGKSGIMGAVVEGNVAANGWAAGSNVPHIIEIEGLPDGLSSFWLRDDIYTRMEVMIENSDAFIIMPGGAGSVQELLALMIFKTKDDALMKDKPVYIFNRPLPDGGGFWDPVIRLLGDLCPQQPPHVCSDIDLLMEELQSTFPQRVDRLSPLVATT
ncbi:MAG: LOG family protein [Verrucomicrobiota bacterium]